MDKQKTDERGQGGCVKAASFSPLELNALHEGLQRLIVLGQPPKTEVLLCTRFLDAVIAQGSHAWQAFGWDIAGHLARRLPSISMWGFSPAELGRIEAILLHAMGRGSGPGQNPQTMEGNLQGALEALRGHQRELDRLLCADDPGSSPVAEERDLPGEASILVPVIEKLNAADHAPDFFSGIQKGSVVLLSVVVSDRSGSKERGPQRHRQGPQGSDGQFLPQIFGPVPARTAAVLREAADRLDSLGRWSDRAGLPRLDECVLSIRFSPEEARLDGDSAGLAFILAAAAARASLAPGRRRVRLALGLAATGVLEATSVAPVEPRTLEAKVEAAFFSRVRLLLVPASQESAARACLDRLLSAYPNRDLSLCGVWDVAEIPPPRLRVCREMGLPPTLDLRDALVADPRGAMDTAASWVRWLGRSKWRTAAVIAASLAVFTMLGWELYRQWPSPAEVRWIDDKRIELRNRRGVAFRQVKIPYRPLHADLAPFHGLWHGIIDLEGRRSATAFVIHGSDPNGKDLLSVVDRRGRIIWRKEARSPVPGWETALSEHCWYPFVAFGSVGRCQRLLLPSRSTQWSECVLYFVVLESDGQLALRGGLFNDGHLERFPYFDLTDDGKVELLALGTHNGFLPDAVSGAESRGRGIAAVLDPEAAAGMILPSDFNDLPRISDGETLGVELLAAWTFAQDRFSNHARAHVVNADRAGDDRIRIFLQGARIDETDLGSIRYELIGEDLLRPDDVQVFFGDGYLAWIRNNNRGNEIEAAIQEEIERLRSEVMALTPEGWRPVVQSSEQFSARPEEGN